MQQQPSQHELSGENWVGPIIARTFRNVQDFFVHKAKPGINHALHPHFYWLKPFPCLRLVNCSQNKEQLYILSCQNVRSFHQGQPVPYNSTVSLLLKSTKRQRMNSLYFLRFEPARKVVSIILSTGYYSFVLWVNTKCLHIFVSLYKGGKYY